MKRFLSLLLVLCLLCTLVPMGAMADFSDTGALNKSYRESIAWAVEQGITTGYADNSFRPNNSCTRAQAVTFLWRAVGQPAPQSAKNPFTDVSDSGSLAPYYKAILWAVEQGITNGYEDKTFRPNATVTRGQFVTFLWRMEGQPAPSGGVEGFADAAKIAGPYVDAVAWAVEQGVTTGYEDDSFRPNNVCTRAQVVTFLFRDLQNAKYTVSFDSCGGSPVAAQRIKQGECAERPADPTRDGYMFCGWYSSEDFETEYDFSAPVGGSLTLYALWLLDNEAYEAVTGTLSADAALAEAPYTDGDGFVAEEDKTAAVDAVYASWSALSDPYVVEILNGIVSVTAVLSDGSCVFYAPAIPNTLSHEYGVSGYATTEDDASLAALFSSDICSQRAAKAVYQGAEEYTTLRGSGRIGLTVGELLTEFGTYKNGDPRVIFWHGHGSYVNYRIGSSPVFFVNDTVNKEFRTEYAEDIVANRIIVTGSGKSCVLTDRFFREYLPEVNGGLFVASSCYGYMSDAMKNAFIDKGFDAYIGYDNSVQLDAGCSFLVDLAKQLIKKDENGFYVPLQEAVGKADGLMDGVSFCADVKPAFNIHATHLCVYDKQPDDPFRLVPIERTLRFTVVDDHTGEAIPNAEVTVSNLNRTSVIRVRSDKNGEVSAELDFTGIVSVTVEAKSYAADVSVFQTKDYRDRQLVELPEVRLTGLFSVSALVVDADTGKAIPGVSVDVYRSGAAEPAASAETDAGGAFRFDALPSGSCRFVLRCAGYTSANVTLTGKAGESIVCAEPLKLTPEKPDYSLYGDVLLRAKDKNIDSLCDAEGFLCDLNGDGVTELCYVNCYVQPIPGGDGGMAPYFSVSVYTLKDGKALCLIDGEPIHMYVGGNRGNVAAVTLDGRTYLRTYSAQGSNADGYTYRYALFSLDGSTAAKAYTAVYTGGNTAELNGKTVSYSEYHSWIASQKATVFLDNSPGAIDKAMSIDELYEQVMQMK